MRWVIAWQARKELIFMGRWLVPSCLWGVIEGKCKYGNVNMDANVDLFLKTELVGNCHFLTSGQKATKLRSTKEV